MDETLGFSVHRKKSNVATAGNGVFICKGQAKQGSLVALYPGQTVDYSFKKCCLIDFK